MEDISYCNTLIGYGIEDEDAYDVEEDVEEDAEDEKEEEEEREKD